MNTPCPDPIVDARIGKRQIGIDNGPEFDFPLAYTYQHSAGLVAIRVKTQH